MRKLIVLGCICSAVVWGQTLDIRFRGDIERMTFVGETVSLPDGGDEVTLFACTALEAARSDGGTWPLAVTGAGPATRANANQAIRECKRDLLRANRLDGGN